MKKILALLLVLALSLTLVACGSGNTTETKAPEMKPAETKADAAPATEGRSFHWQLQGRHGYRLR